MTPLVLLAPGLPDGVVSDHPCGLTVLVSVCLFVFRYLFISFLLIFCMKLGYHKGKKVTEPDF